MSRTLYLVDGHAQIYRAYYAPFRNLTAPSGEPTRATYVFCQMLLNLIRDRRPDYLAMVLDSDESQLRRRVIYPAYKATRPPTPEDLPVQEERIVSVLAAARVPLLRRLGWEADDIIATLARRLAGPDLHVFVVSRDKDLDQIIGPHVTLYDPMKDEQIDAARLMELKGWRPEQAVDAQTLMGDSTDNVPGVPGVGPKTAAKLLQQYGSLPGILAHVDELSPKLRDSLKAAGPQLELARRLVTLADDVPLELDLEQALCCRFAWPRVRPIFETLGFRRLAEELPAGECGAPPVSAAARPAAGGELEPSVAPQELEAATDADAEARAAASALRVPEGGEYRLVNTPEGLDTLTAALACQPEFAIDTETTGTNPMDCELVGIALAWEVGRGYYVPVRSIYGPVLELERVRQKLGPILADASKRKVGQHLKYDLNVLRNNGLPVAGPYFDTMIASFVIDPTRSSNSLDALAFSLLGHRMIPITDLIGKGRDQLCMDQVRLEQVAEYSAEDADYTWRLFRLLEPQLAPLGVDRLFYEVEMPLVAVLTDMEAHGVSIDVKLLAEMGRQLATRAEELARQVHAAAGVAFNLDSPKQLAEVLFDRLGLPVQRRTKTTRSTDADTLAALRDAHPVCPLLLEYREIQKLRGTYVDALPAQRSRRTGRIHTSYHQTGAVTGRLSSSEPNLQNIPVRTEIGREIRRAFIPRSPDERLIVADYSQVELRILAHYCRDDGLLRAFAADQDIHATVAAEVNGVPLEQVSKEMRARAKAVNFGIVYGQTAFGLAQQTGMGRAEAQEFIDRYFARYPGIRRFIRDVVESARRDGFVRTILGRRRPISGLDSRNAGIRNQAERFAVNTVIQGSAADLIKIAMIRLHRRIAEEGLPLRMLMQVHDELVCEGPADEAPRLARVMREIMAGAMELRVPLRADVGWGPNWLEAK